jgi:hypothetical protein
MDLGDNGSGDIWGMDIARGDMTMYKELRSP